MGKFGDYVGAIKQQTDDLREVVSAKSGVDCSNHSIGDCSAIVDSLKVEGLEDRYVRPSWYPDIEVIINNAPEITKDDVVYSPAYIMLFDDSQVDTAFYYGNNHNTSSAVNYKRGTGVEAYVFGDTINNNAELINSDNLQVGNEIIHAWDFTQFIKNPNGVDKVAWVIFYKKNIESVQISSHANFYNMVEYVVKRGVYYNILDPSSPSYTGHLKYFKICSGISTELNNSNANFYGLGSSYAQLKEVVIEPPLTEIRINGSSIFTDCKTLKRIIGVENISSNYPPGYTGCSSLKELKIPSKLTSFSGNIKGLHQLKRLTIEQETIFSEITEMYSLEECILINTKSIKKSSFLSDCYNLKYIKIPSTLESWTTTAHTLNYCPYVELFTDFNISGVNLSGNTSSTSKLTKSIQWLKDLCGWLKDRTAEDAGSFIIGTANLNNANNIYLTFNPNDKRDITFDGVTAETEGAVSIVDFITNQLNWTLS